MNSDGTLKERHSRYELKPDTQYPTEVEMEVEGSSLGMQQIEGEGID